MMPNRAASLLFILCAAMLMACAQADAASDRDKVKISGVLKDSEGHPAAGATIKFFRVVANPGNGPGGNKFGTLVATTTTNERGEWEVSLKPGDYRYFAGNARTTGFRSGEFTVVEDKPATVDIQLSPPQKG